MSSTMMTLQFASIVPKTTAFCGTTDRTATRQRSTTKRSLPVTCSGIYYSLKQTTAATAAALTIFAAAPQAQALCPDLISAPSGLQYCDVKIGSGDPPVKGAFIKAHYEGRLDSDIASGTFDSSYERGRPLGFAIGTGQVIKGWDEGIGGGEGVEPMKVGGKRQLVIPAQLGYGSKGAGGVIPPGATLYFDVELVGILGRK